MSTMYKTPGMLAGLWWVSVTMCYYSYYLMRSHSSLKAEPGLEPRVGFSVPPSSRFLPGEKRRGLFWQQEPTGKSPVDSDPSLERGGWEILGVRDYKDLLYFLSFSLTSGVIGMVCVWVGDLGMHGSKGL